jgi:hypothetical protein
VPSKIDERRLRDGAEAMALPAPRTLDEARNYVSVLHDGMVALQSLDDLGSEDANRRAWDDMLELERRSEAVKLRFPELTKR